MFDQYVQQLASQNVETRRQAIIGLGKSEDKRALGPLSTIYKTDPDPSIRELALKVGRYIKSRADQGASQPAISPSASPSVSTPSGTQANYQAKYQAREPEPTTLPSFSSAYSSESNDSGHKLMFVSNEPAAPVAKAKVITERDKKAAKSLLDSAIAMSMNRQNDKAMSELIGAVRIDPEMAKNRMAQNLASSLTGIENVEDAMATVKNKALYAGQSTISATGQMPNEARVKFSITDEMLEVILMMVGLFIILAVYSIMSKYGLTAGLEQLSKSASSSVTSEKIATLRQELGRITISDLLIGGLMGTFNTVISVGLIYIMGILMGGAGDLFKFISGMIRVQIVSWLLLTVSLGIFMFALFGNLPPRTASIVLLIGAGLLFLSSLFSFCYLIYTVSKRHEVGLIKAFLIVFVSGIVSNILSFIFGMLRA